jgi:hypothetical protein
MTETRRLAAMLAAAVVGYSRLMGEDDAGQGHPLAPGSKATKLCRASHSMLHDRSTLNGKEEAKQREPTHEYHQSVATFMAPDSHFTWSSSVIWLGCRVVLVVIASCRVKSGGPVVRCGRSGAR